MLQLFADSNRRSISGCSPLCGKLFVVMGAGGAGKAIAYGGKEKGARVVVANRIYGEKKICWLIRFVFIPEDAEHDLFCFFSFDY